MSDTPRKPPSTLWKWTKRIGCAMLLLSFTCCFVTCAGSWWVQDGLRNMNKDEVDRIHADGLRGGNLEAMHARADAAFRKRFTLDDLRAFQEKRTGLFDRENFFGMEFQKRRIDGVEYVKITSKRGWFSLEQWEIVLKIVDGEYQLVGISPGLDELVPIAFRKGAGGGRRHRWWD